MFNNIGPWDQCYQTFYSRDLQIFVISLSVCICKVLTAWSNALPGNIRLDRLARDKHSSLLRKICKLRTKMFNNIGPWDQRYQTFYCCKLVTFVKSWSVCPWKVLTV
jgi:hypothetical protein